MSGNEELLSKRSEEVLEDTIEPDELREFLEADLLGAQADPEFRERLRQKLLALVRSKYGPPTDKGS